MSEQITEFRRWRTGMDFTQAQAADALGVSLSSVKNWDAGVDRGTGLPSYPPLGKRTLMSVIYNQMEVEPWPDRVAVKRKRGATTP